MPVLLIERDDGKLLEVHASGKLRHEDYVRFVPEFDRLAEQHGKLRVLFEMENFHGWDASALWDDIKFDLRHFAAIDRLAIAGERNWQKWMGKVCRPFTSAGIRYFNNAELDRARGWLREKPGKIQPPPLRVFQTREQTRAYYNKLSAFYDALSDRSEAPVRKAGLGLLKACDGEKLLEIGFGTGHCVGILANAVGINGKVFGIDLSERMVRRAKENLSASGLLGHTKLQCGDATGLPYADGIMDGVFMSFTLELFDTPEIPKVLNECKRVLRTGGRIVVVAMSKKGKRKPLVGFYEWAHEHFPNFLDCRPIYAQQALKDSGFVIEKTMMKKMWVPVELILARKP
jgi:ubiquinone/menaquinone biosynthesis C-methylase UbiE